MKFERYPIPTCCLYCGAEDILHTTNDFLYGRKFYTKGNCLIYVCVICKASVGTHPDGETPLGRLADKELKELKKEAHALFDPHWEPDRKKRDRAYKKLAEKMGIPARQCHFGWFDKETILRAIAILKVWRPRKRKTS